MLDAVVTLTAEDAQVVHEAIPALEPLTVAGISSLVEVVDERSGFEYTVREYAFEQVGGRGLSIVDAETSRSGMHEGTTHV